VIYGISTKKEAVLRIQSEILRTIREFLTKKGFLEIKPPIIERFTDPGLRGAEIFEIEFYGEAYKIMSALTLQKPILASQLGKIFALCPCLRKEELKARDSGRHLSEFWQLEVEIPEATYKDAMDTAETLLTHIIKSVKEHCPEELKVLERKLKIPEKFKRITHREATEIARSLGYQIKDGEELPWEIEKAISLTSTDPFFVMEYPIGSRGFYDKTDTTKLLCFDMMYPEGYGEASSGSEREFEFEKVKQKIKLEGFDEYLEILKKGIKPTAGFGIGLERLTRFICGLERIEQATLFPKLPGGRHKYDDKKIRSD
jgi:asparaginyl-tRNA synthetase